MNYVAVTLKGIEDIAAKELKSIDKQLKVIKIEEARIIFSTKSIEKIKEAKTIIYLYELFARFNFKKTEDFSKELKKIDFSFIKKDFVVKCNREGEHNFNSNDIARYIGEIIYKKGFKVNLDSDTAIYIDIIKNKAFIGKLLVKEKLSKREYRLKLSNKTVNPCLAAALILISKSKKEDPLLDPFCKDGIIPIEAALIGYKNVYGIDETENNVRMAKINSKLANAKVKLLHNKIDWIDTYFKKDSLTIITNPPTSSKIISESEITKLYNEFFNQAKFVLKNKMVIAITKKDLFNSIAKSFKFKLLEERKVIIGDLGYYILIYKNHKN
ncbi:methyltransferase [Candidatus Woesearchaeota archaeon]|nr:methyltransferase [Candidatus Woesearchaeota archaeon]